jgi:hypothetical protein
VKSILMNKFTKRFISGFLILLLMVPFLSCGVTRKPIEEIAPYNNASYKVEYLFEHDGCKVYRFMDNGHYVYFTNCRGDVTSIESDSTVTRITNRTIR